MKRVESTVAHARGMFLGSGLGPKLVRAVISGAGIRFAGMFFGFLVSVQLARSLGPDGYGVYGLAMAIIAVLTVPTEFGFPQLATREIAAAHVHGQWERIRALLQWFTRTILILSSLLLLAIFLLLWINIAQPEKALSQTLLVGIFLIPAVALLHLYCSALRGMQHLVVGQVPDILLRPAFHSLLLFLVFWVVGYPESPQAAMALGVAAVTAGLGISILLLKTRLPDAKTQIYKIDGSLLWRDALPMAMTEGMRMLQGHIVVFMLGIFTLASVVGYFKVASGVMVLISTPIALLNIIGAPVISRLYNQDDRFRLQRLLSMLSLAMTVSCSLLALPFLVSGEKLISWGFGSEFIPSAGLLNVLIVGILGSSIFGASAGLLNMTGHAGRVTRASVWSILALVSACMILMPNLDATGGALAAAGSLILWNFLMWRDGKKYLGLDSAIWSRV